MATILIPARPDSQINIDTGGGNGIAGAQQFPQVTALADGRFAVVYQSPQFGNASDNDIIAAFLNPDGSLSTPAHVDVYALGGQQTGPAVAARPGGEFGVVFTNDRHADGTVDPNGTNITYRSVSATGGLGTPLTIGDFNGSDGQDALQSPAIATLQSGRQIVVFDRTLNGSHGAYLNIINAAGTATEYSAAAPLAIGGALTETDPAIATSGENALVAYQINPPLGNSDPLFYSDIELALFDGGTNTLTGVGLAFDPSLQSDFARYSNVVVLALDSTRYVVAFQIGSALNAATSVGWGIYDAPSVKQPANDLLTQLGGAGGTNASHPSLARTSDGGFIVSWTESNGTDLDVHAQVFNSAGAPLGNGPLTLGTMTDAAQDYSFVATNADHAIFAWQDSGVRATDGFPTSVRGESFQMISASHSDFSGDGVDDVMWRHTNGQVAEWQMKAGNIASGGNSNVASIAANWHILDTGDLNGDGYADVLWRHDSGQVVLWSMRGSVIAQNQSIATIGNDWHNEGVGDFSGDGRADVLWRNDSGQTALWTMNGTNIVNNQSVANISLDWHNQGLGDFNADGHTDVLWRHTSGQVVMWQMNGATITSNTAVTNLGLDWHVLGIGDFNGDGRADVLLRHNSGLVVEWQMNGSTIVSNQAVANIDASWHLVDIADHTGDGRSDVLWRNDSGQTVIWEMNGAAITANHSVGNIALDYTPLTHHYDLI